MAGFITRRMELVQAFQEATGTDVTEVLEVIGRQTVKKVSITTIEGQEAEPPLVIDSANDVGQGMLIAVIEYASEHDWPEIIDHGDSHCTFTPTASWWQTIGACLGKVWGADDPSHMYANWLYKNKEKRVSVRFDFDPPATSAA